MSIVWMVLLVLVGGLTPATAFAHVKWFTDPALHPPRTDLVMSGSTALWLGASVVVVLWVSLAQRLVGSADWPRFRLWTRLAAGGPTQLAVLGAIALVSAAVRPALFAPNLSLPSAPLGLCIASIEVLVAATFVTGVADWIGALVLLALFPIGAVLFSPLEMAAQLHLAGLALVVLIIGRRASHGGVARVWIAERDALCAGRALAFLRILTGIAIIAAACEEKLWNPALGRAFLADHPLFNVLRGLPGVPISDDTFVLLIGIAEGVLGVLLVSGLMTRVVVLSMWLPFNLGIPFLPPQELLGHLPIFGAMYLLLAHGGGAVCDWRLALARVTAYPSAFARHVSRTRVRKQSRGVVFGT